MSTLADLTAPLLIGAVMLLSTLRGVDVYEGMLAGVEKGLRVMRQILPTLIVLFPALWLLRASGLPEALGRLLAPLFEALAIPPETGLILLLRPFSGSAALSAAAEIMGRCGADSLAGRTAAVMLGSSETTFYVAALYFSAAGLRRCRWAIPAALCADLACFLSSAWICRLIWG